MDLKKPLPRDQAGNAAVRATVTQVIEDIRERGDAAVLAMLAMPGLCGADIDLSAGMIAP